MLQQIQSASQDLEVVGSNALGNGWVQGNGNRHGLGDGIHRHVNALDHVLD